MRTDRGQDKTHGHHHDHHHGHDIHLHTGLATMSPNVGSLAGVHRLNRRQFIADLGRGTLALAILGPMAACSSSSNSSDESTSPSEGEANDQDLQWSQVSLGFVSAYVLVRGNTAAVVDSGTPGSATAIGEGLATFGVTFDDVDHVLLTHAHGDHVGSLPEVLGQAPNAMVYAGAPDAPKIDSGEVAITTVGDGDDVFGLQIIETPGHTEGSISMLDTGIGLLIAGDALNTNADGSEITASNPDFTADMAGADESVKKLAGFEVDAVVVGHGNPVTSGAGTLISELAAGL